MIVSGFGFRKETRMIFEELENAFPKVTLACAKKCRTNQYGIAKPCLANAYHEIAEEDEYYGHLKPATRSSPSLKFRISSKGMGDSAPCWAGDY